MTNEQKDKNSWGAYHLQGKPGNSGWKMRAIGCLIRFYSHITCPLAQCGPDNVIFIQCTIMKDRMELK